MCNATDRCRRDCQDYYSVPSLVKHSPCLVVPSRHAFVQSLCLGIAFLNSSLYNSATPNKLVDHNISSTLLFQQLNFRRIVCLFSNSGYQDILKACREIYRRAEQRLHLLYCSAVIDYSTVGDMHKTSRTSSSPEQRPTSSEDLPPYVASNTNLSAAQRASIPDLANHPMVQEAEFLQALRAVSSREHHTVSTAEADIELNQIQPQEVNLGAGTTKDLKKKKGEEEDEVAKKSIRMLQLWSTLGCLAGFLVVLTSLGTLIAWALKGSFSLSTYWTEWVKELWLWGLLAFVCSWAHVVTSKAMEDGLKKRTTKSLRARIRYYRWLVVVSCSITLSLVALMFTVPALVIKSR